MPSPFEVLGIDPDADEADLKRAYRRRVKETHPDHGGSAREFRRVRDAYEAVKSGRIDGTAAGTADWAADGATDGRSPAEREGENDRPGTTRVEYLDYEVLTDLGWDLEDGDLFDRAAAADLDQEAYGRFEARADETLLEAAEARGYAWPFACRGGACANCAVVVLEGELSTPVNHVLPPSMIDRGIRLSCVGRPTTDELRVVYNVKHLPALDDLLLSSSRFEKTYD